MGMMNGTNMKELTWWNQLRVFTVIAHSSFFNLLILHQSMYTTCALQPMFLNNTNNNGITSCQERENNHQPKSADWRRTNCFATTRMMEKDRRRYTEGWASHWRMWAWETYRRQTWSSSSSAAGPKDPQVEKPKGEKSNPCEMQDRACFSLLPCSTEKRVEVTSCQPMRAEDTPTRSTQQCFLPNRLSNLSEHAYQVCSRWA